MLSFSDLTEHQAIGQINVTDTEGVLTLDNLNYHISNTMAEEGIEVEIKYDEIKSGNIFKSQKQPCIIISSKDHPYDYYKYCITLRQQGTAIMVNTYLTGTSKLESDLIIADARAQSGGFLGKLINKISAPDEFKLQDEQFYYTTLNNCILNIFRR